MKHLTALTLFLKLDSHGKSNKNEWKGIRGERKNREEREVVAVETEKGVVLTM